MYKIILSSANKRFRNLCTAFIVVFSSTLVFGIGLGTESTYNFGLFYPHTETDSQNSDDGVKCSEEEHQNNRRSKFLIDEKSNF